MRAIWSGSINFGMVSIPAKLYTATDDRREIHPQHRVEEKVIRWIRGIRKEKYAHEVKACLRTSPVYWRCF